MGPLLLKSLDSSPDWFKKAQETLGIKPQEDLASTDTGDAVDKLSEVKPTKRRRMR